MNVILAGIVWVGIVGWLHSRRWRTFEGPMDL